RCSSILATSERQDKNLTKPLFQNGCPSCRNTPLNTTFLRFYGIALEKNEKSLQNDTLTNKMKQCS
ncbi:MAG: hypothetical protein SPK75_03440, partial [Victivallales bacterium]|nr:hypothetical protein [Victivallales bacterium]